MAEPFPDIPINHTPFTPLGEDTKTISQKAEQDLLDQIPIIKQIIKHYDQKIAFLSSTDTIADEILNNPELFMHIVAGRKIALGIIKTQKDYLQSKISAVLSKQ